MLPRRAREFAPGRTTAFPSFTRLRGKFLISKPAAGLISVGGKNTVILLNSSACAYRGKKQITAGGRGIHVCFTNNVITAGTKKSKKERKGFPLKNFSGFSGFAAKYSHAKFLSNVYGDRGFNAQSPPPCQRGPRSLL
jgi:hypothetical protein